MEHVGLVASFSLSREAPWVGDLRAGKSLSHSHPLRSFASPIDKVFQVKHLENQLKISWNQPISNGRVFLLGDLWEGDCQSEWPPRPTGFWCVKTIQHIVIWSFVVSGFSSLSGQQWRQTNSSIQSAPTNTCHCAYTMHKYATAKPAAKQIFFVDSGWTSAGTKDTKTAWGVRAVVVTWDHSRMFLWICLEA